MNDISHSFPRESRLLTPFRFSYVFENATPAPSKHITILARQNDVDHPRLGITVPKKKVKRAVDRNRIKRIIRESFRLNQRRLPNVDIIVIAKHGVSNLSNHALFTLLDTLWNKTNKRCQNRIKQQVSQNTAK